MPACRLITVRLCLMKNNDLLARFFLLCWLCNVTKAFSLPEFVFVEEATVVLKRKLVSVATCQI